LVEANTWPNRWSGEEELGDAAADRVLRTGEIQPLLSGILVQ
jgi:hypothetical protein